MHHWHLEKEENDEVSESIRASLVQEMNIEPHLVIKMRQGWD